MTAPDALRLFLGVRVAAASATALAEAAAAMKGRAEAAGLRVRWVAPEGYHVTLKFLGWSRQEAVFALRDRVGRALEGAASFAMTVRGAGAFPGPERARVLWAGIEEPGPVLAALAERIEEAVAGLGFARERRPYHAHVTLGRVKDPGDARAVLEPALELDFGTTRVDEVVLFQSVMRPTGATYTALTGWTLRGDERG